MYASEQIEGVLATLEGMKEDLITSIIGYLDKFCKDGECNILKEYESKSTDIDYDGDWLEEFREATICVDCVTQLGEIECGYVTAIQRGNNEVLLRAVDNYDNEYITDDIFIQERTLCGILGYLVAKYGDMECKIGYC